MPTTPHPLLQALTTAPPLVTHLPGAPTFNHHALQLPADPPSLNPNQKLGHLCEDALAILLDTTPNVELLARNLQLHDADQKTLGELDFLLRDHSTGQLIHLELATKFYLAVFTGDNLALPGPDARDNYFKKIHRLRTHQLTLTQRYRQHLPEPYRTGPITTQQLIHGCLFDHIHATTPATAEFISPNCRRGRWLTIDECGSHFHPDTTFHILPKPLWPVPLELLADLPLEPWTPTTRIGRCVMLRTTNSSLPHFVTPSGYPIHNTGSISP